MKRLSYYQMLPEKGSPESTVWEYPRGGDSKRLEFEEYFQDIRLDRRPSATRKDALPVLTIVEGIYIGSGYDHRP